MYTTRRNGFDREDARMHHDQLQKRKPKLVSPGDRVVMNDSKDAQVYTVVETYSVTSVVSQRIMAKLIYVSEFGKTCDAGAVDASMLMTPFNAS